ncbi:MAG: hypothetical protein H8E61_02235, partial [Bacteroidetes bacterium]|nr:hypothetical protein [Bacteroidota bacterium]
MKIKIISPFLFFVIAGISVFGQIDIDIEDIETSSEQKSEHSTNLAYFYSIQHWQNLPDLLSTKAGRNHESGILLFFDLFDLNSQVNLSTGVSFKISHLHSNVNDWTDDGLSDSYDPTYFLNSFDFHKNKLVSGWLGIPLCLSLNTSRDYKKTIKIQGGINGSYLLYAHTKLVYDITKLKVKAGAYINPYRLDAICTFGWRFAYVYASSELNPFFNIAESSLVQNWTSGLAIYL